MRWLVVGLTFLVASCGGLDIEHQIRVGTDCPDPEVVARNVVYPIPGGTLTCNHVRVVSGPPYRNATFLECQTPVYPEPPSERRKGPYEAR